MIELMKELCALPGPSGCEDAVRAFVLKRVKPFADEIRTDAIGNVMVFRKGRKALDRPVALCAHMDEVGVIIKKITEDGMLKFGFVGGVDPRVVIGRPVRFGDVPGVIGAAMPRERSVFAMRFAAERSCSFHTATSTDAGQTRLDRKSVV